jgi:hypothetical protein
MVSTNPGIHTQVQKSLENILLYYVRVFYNALFQSNIFINWNKIMALKKINTIAAHINKDVVKSSGVKSKSPKTGLKLC